MLTKKVCKYVIFLTLCAMGITLVFSLNVRNLIAKSSPQINHASQQAASTNDNEVYIHQEAPAGFAYSINPSPIVPGNTFKVIFKLKDHYSITETPAADNITGEKWEEGGTAPKTTFKVSDSITYNSATEEWTAPFSCPLLSANEYLVINLSKTTTDKTDIATYSDIPSCVSIAFSTPTSQVFCNTTLKFTAKLKDAYATFGIKKIWMHYDSLYDNEIHDDEIPINPNGSYEVTLPWTNHIDIGCEAGPVVHFDAMGGDPAPGDQIVPLNNPDAALVPKPADPPRGGYTFTGWFTDDACTSAFDFTTPLTLETTSPFVL